MISFISYNGWFISQNMLIIPLVWRTTENSSIEILTNTKEGNNGHE
jgi:hypothetical protein